MEMKRILSKNVVFEAFMRQLVKEYCHECLLCIIEMIQFKERIKKRLTQRQRLSIEQSAKQQFSAYFLSLPRQCPKSAIVTNGFNHKGHLHNGTRADYKSIAREIYLKYLKRSAIYEINVDYRTRKDLADLIDTNRWETNEEYGDPKKLYFMF